MFSTEFFNSLGYKQTFRGMGFHVRSYPESGHSEAFSKLHYPNLA